MKYSQSYYCSSDVIDINTWRHIYTQVHSLAMEDDELAEQRVGIMFYLKIGQSSQKSVSYLQ